MRSFIVAYLLIGLLVGAAAVDAWDQKCQTSLRPLANVWENLAVRAVLAGLWPVPLLAYFGNNPLPRCAT